MSRCPLCPDDLFPNLALKEDIELWLADHPEGADGAPPLPLPVEPPAPAKACPSISHNTCVWMFDVQLNTVALFVLRYFGRNMHF